MMERRGTMLEFMDTGPVIHLAEGAEVAHFAVG